MPDHGGTPSAAPPSSTPGATAPPGAAVAPGATSAPGAYPGLPRLARGSLPTFKKAPKPVRPAFAPGALPPVLHRVPTSQRVAFITIDDGLTRLPEALALLKAAGVPVSLFLISSVAEEDPAYFRALTGAGALIESHTVDHPSLRGLPYRIQKQQICGSSDTLGSLYGRRPVLFRPPYGEYDQTTLRAARDCGIKAVLHWREAANGGKVFYQTPEKKVQPGDIILMHFRPAFVADFVAVLKAISDAGLTPALLEDYVG